VTDPEPTVGVAANVHRTIRRYARRKTAVTAAGRLSLAADAFGALLLAALLVDRFVEMPAALKVAASLAVAAVPALVVLTLAVSLLRRGGPDRLAGELDARTPGARDLLRSCLSLSRRHRKSPGSVNAFMLGRTVHQAETLSETIAPARLVRWGRAPVRLAAAGLLAGVFVALLFWPYMRMDLLLRRLVDPLGNHPRPSLTRIDVQGPMRRQIPAGDDLVVSVRLDGQVPDPPHTTLHLVQGDREKLVLMTPRPGDRFETELKGISADASLYVTAGDGRSAIYRVAVIPRPNVLAPQVRYDYPRYTSLPRVAGPLESRQIKAVVGTRVRLTFGSSLAVRDSHVIFGKTMGARKLRIRWDKARTTGTVSFRIERDATFRIHLAADNGTDNRRDGAYRVRAIPDNPPTVALTEVPATLSFFREDILRLEYKGSDDFGIAEAFLRCRLQPKGHGSLVEWSIDLPKLNAKTAGGSVAVDLRELTGPLTESIQVQLVMTDTNDGEGATSPLQLRIISDSTERQLAELLAFQTRYGKYLGLTLAALRTKAAQLGVLIDGMDAKTPLTDKRREMLQGLDRRVVRAAPRPRTYSLMRAASPLKIFRMFPYTEYPYHSLRKTERCLSSWSVLRPVAISAAEWKAIEAAPAPKAQLVAIRDRAAAHAADVGALAAAMAETIQETRLRRMLLLTDTYLRAGPTRRTLAGDDLAEDLRKQKQAEALDAIETLAGETAEAIQDPALAAALKGLADARKLPAGQSAPAARKAVEALARRLRVGADLDGRLGRRLEAFRRSRRLGDEIRKARSAGQLALLAEALAIRIRLRRDNYVLNDAALLLAVRIYEAVLTGRDDRIDAAVAASRRLADWAQRHDVLGRARLLRQRVRSLADDIRMGRVQLDSPQLDVRWHLTRELVLSLLRDLTAGRLAELPATVREAIGKLAPLRDLLARPGGKKVLTDPGYPAARSALVGMTETVIATLDPLVDRDAPHVAAETRELLRDLAGNFRAEAGRVRREIEAITREIGPIDPAPKDRQAFEAMLGKVRRPTPPRARFSENHAEQMSLHAVAAAKVLDVRQAAKGGLGRGDGDSELAEAAAMSILTEYLAHLDEHTYDRLIAIYKTGYGTAVIFTVVARQFYREAAPMLERLGVWTDRLAADEGAALLKDRQYAGLLNSVHKATRHRAAMASLVSHGKFGRTWRAATSPQRRRAALHMMMERDDEKMAYWESLYLAAAEVAARVDGALRAEPGSQPRPLDAGRRAAIDAAIRRTRWILPDGDTAGPEAKPLASLLGQFDAPADAFAAAGFSRLPPDQQEAVIEDLRDWHSRLLGAIRNLEARVTRPPIRHRPRLRYQRSVRTDLAFSLGRILRNESRWSLRVAEAAWDSRGARARGLIGVADRNEVHWLSAWEQICRRKSAAVAAQQSRAIGPDGGEVDARFLKMPRHLYRELRRALRKPYPSQFKMPALEYMHALVGDAR